MVVAPASRISETVLEGAPDTLYAAFGLGCVGQDVADIQLLKRPTELCGVTPAPELLGDGLGLCGSALEDAVPVAAQGQWNALTLTDLIP